MKSAAWSLDGESIVTASGDQTAKVRDATSGQALATLRGHTLEVYSAEWSPDGKSIVTASGDGTARQLVIDLGALMSLAQTRIAQALTPEERTLYLGDPLPTPPPTPAANPTPDPWR